MYYSLQFNNHYFNRYNKIIQHYKSRTISGYTESHHIIPKSCGGSDDPDNIVELCARGHFICHYLLWKMMPTGSVERKKMAYAFNQMRRIGGSSSLYSSFREEFASQVGEDKKGNSYCKGMKTYYDPSNNKIFRGHEIPNGFVAGNPKPTLDWRSTRVKITDGINEKWHNIDTDIPDGWKRGRADSFKQRVAQTSKGNKSNLGKRSTRTEETKRKISDMKKGKLPPNVGKSQFHNPVTGKKIWSAIDSVPEGFVPGWGKDFSDKIKMGMR